MSFKPAKIQAEAKAPAAVKRRLFKRFDLLIIAGLLALAWGTHFFYQQAMQKTDLVADIYYQNERIDSIELRKGSAKTFSYPENPAVIFALHEDGSISFEESDCPDQICVHSGHLHSEHAFAACLPNHFLLVVRAAGSAPSSGEPEVDIVN